MRDDLEKFNNAMHCHVYKKPFAPDDTYVIIAIWLGDSEVPRIQIAI